MKHQLTAELPAGRPTGTSTAASTEESAGRSTGAPTGASAGLATELREGTRAEHRAAESAGFVTALLDGRLGPDAYADLAAQQLGVYRALEAGGGRLTGAAAVLVAPELARTAALEADLAHLWGPAWRGRVEPVPAVRRYVSRLDAVAATDVGYAAHAYVRYLGDLSGGQVVAAMLRRHYGVAEEGLRFYRFDGIEKVKPYKDAYRARLDALPFGATERAAVVAEARYALRLNREVFDDLADRHLRS
ncbi:heme oxygenase (biliverdin-producing) [Georgenia muralis]|uniref:Heme oxygenase n=1 Tax=Georgenia muralis TaxID=154117 RepID=A0A3N5AB65_9MICO|nr:biliverdin-producing heme oxygenase [Georgenia muralis]RPF28881.1 heme oxygenase [Georgenia muralis]